MSNEIQQHNGYVQSQETPTEARGDSCRGIHLMDMICADRFDSER